MGDAARIKITSEFSDRKPISIELEIPHDIMNTIVKSPTWSQLVNVLAMIGSQKLGRSPSYSPGASLYPSMADFVPSKEQMDTVLRNARDYAEKALKNSGINFDSCFPIPPSKDDLFAKDKRIPTKKDEEYVRDMQKRTEEYLKDDKKPTEP